MDSNHGDVNVIGDVPQGWTVVATGVDHPSNRNLRHVTLAYNRASNRYAGLALGSMVSVPQAWARSVELGMLRRNTLPTAAEARRRSVRHPVPSLTQAELAERMGVDANTVARWERGERTLSDAMIRLARAVTQGNG